MAACVCWSRILDNLAFSASYVLIRHPRKGETVHWGHEPETLCKAAAYTASAPCMGHGHWCLETQTSPAPSAWCQLPCKPPGHQGKGSWLWSMVNLSTKGMVEAWMGWGGEELVECIKLLCAVNLDKAISHCLPFSPDLTTNPTCSQTHQKPFGQGRTPC